MGTPKASLSATNLATYHHLNCDLYLWNTYNEVVSSPYPPQDTPPTELSKAQFHRGEEWETTLLSWLDKSNLLLRVPPIPMEADVLMENILADDRDHFFIAGLRFWPPRDALVKQFEANGTQPVNFGLGKPDLVEIIRKGDKATWKVLDAKASKSVKTSHHAQVYFYTLCLKYILEHAFFESTNSAGIWLPPLEGFDITNPNLGDIKTIDITLLSASLDAFLFKRLPLILSRNREYVQWHLNPLCRTCRFEPECKANTVEAGGLGNIPNVSVEEARILKDFLQLGKGYLEHTNPPLTDIEELDTLINNRGTLKKIAIQSSTTVKKSRELLAVPRHNESSSSMPSPIIEAVKSKSIQVIPRLNYTCPCEEGIAIIVSFIVDPSTPDRGIKYFCATVHTLRDIGLPRISTGSGAELVKKLANLIQKVTDLQASEEHKHLSTQFYVWSTNDRNILQANIIHAALSSTTDVYDARLCIGALAQGASLLQTAYQPVLLSRALLGFLSARKRLKKEYQACLARIGLPTSGSAEECRERVEAAMVRLNQEKGDASRTSRKQRELGQISRVVVLKREVERLLALPVPGYWDLPECFSTMVPESERLAIGCPSEEDLFKVYKHGENVELQALLQTRNHAVFSILSNLRARTNTVNGYNLLVNEAKILSVDFMDLCRSSTLRKLFYMQQFEVLTKLTELWNSRIDGCPDAPILEFRDAKQGSKGIEYAFKLVSGILDAPPDREHPFYDKLLVQVASPEGGMDSSIPVEALFDDLTVSGYVFPLNRQAKHKWEMQADAVKDRLAVAEIRDIRAIGRETIVTLLVWGTWKTRLENGMHYRLSSRFVDFNTAKVLSSLFEIDLQYETDAKEDQAGMKDLTQVPFLQLIEEPQTFGQMPMPERSIKADGAIQRRFRDLSGLGSMAAGSLVLKPSQHRAARRIMTNRLSVIWGPPGTGKTYTICLSLLRLLEIERSQDNYAQRVVFLTAMTHAAIEAMLNKLSLLMDCYRKIDSLPISWLNGVRVERVIQGSLHAAPSHADTTYIYAGTLYQLYNFAKNRNLEVDTVVVDEAGQIALGSLSLVMRSLSPAGRLIVAGDSEQLAPILSAQYPQLHELSLFGSVLDCLMQSSILGRSLPSSVTESQEDTSGSGNTVVQLTENFRLNPDLGEFVSTIYSRQFKPQKVQARQLAVGLRQAENATMEDSHISQDILDDSRLFLLSLSSVMLRRPQNLLRPPRLQLSPQEVIGDIADLTLNHQPISLALIRLKTWSRLSNRVAYEMHVRGEAVVAASLVGLIRKCMPNDDIFVATPHRIQREAVKSALHQSGRNSPSWEGQSGPMDLNSPSALGRVKVDTIERLQGSEAAFVICLFSIPQSHTTDLAFLLERRRLNVAISRAKTLCILVTSNEVLQPPLRSLANEDTAKGFAFLKSYEARAWSYDISVDLDNIRVDM